jgi:hypothetical protein
VKTGRAFLRQTHILEEAHDFAMCLCLVLDVVSHSGDRIVLVTGIDEAGLRSLQVTTVKIATRHQAAPYLLVFGTNFFFCSREREKKELSRNNFRVL